MATHRLRTTLSRARRLIGGLAIAATCLTFGPVTSAHAASLQELRLALDVAEAGLRSTWSVHTRAVGALEDAKEAYWAAHDRVNQTAAALWMLVEPPAQTDLALLDRLAAGIDAARGQIVLAEVDIARARRYRNEVRTIVRGEEARLQAASAAERAQAQAQESTIACPVAYASAIYADFGAPRPSGPHTGIDLPAPTGTTAHASWYAQVVETPLGGWMGKGVILKDGAGNLWSYAHLDSVSVAVGDIVTRGQAIGTVGSTGNSTGPHLHFEIHPGGGSPIDPYSLVAAACGISDPLGPSGRVAHEASTPAAGSS